jgi:UNC-50 family
MCISINVGIIYLLTAFYATHTNDHEETKNTWARDDPAILILMAGGMFGKFPRASDSVMLQHLT